MTILTNSSKAPGQQGSPGAEPQPRLFNVAEYYMMAEAGILRPDESVELLEGRIFEKYPPALRAFTAEEYEHLTRAGILGQERAHRSEWLLISNSGQS